ncbi:nickel/cobalt efflux protein RcnA [Buttiauxella sp. B2]|uniref:nickel/cobalt efflux protein RcnA n=1 Tax=Buttiauxella sp. B2 TaxID=2587812 RepID=UPI001120BB40|nr:nickel/cobalt efflux protein RcnA [Buttiauxella sp. B2]TNV20881.1 nickel/cobalt efflux protein RcnA [Buttiauxella sp. B2]
MTDFSTLIQQGNAWFFIPSAILLGALHGLEPGHSKTMMASFIIAIKGSIRQAVMLGVAATISHTAIVWLIAFGGMYLSKQFTAESVEPWLQLISAIIILGTAIWMFWRTWKGEQLWKLDQEMEYHSHDETKIINTGHGSVELSIFEENQAPHWRLRTLSGNTSKANEVSLVTNRGAGTFSQMFDFIDNEGFLESKQSIPEPHNFNVRLSLGHRGHVHDYDVEFHEHGHDHDHSILESLDVNSKEYQDAHELAHANDIKRRFTNQEVTNWQILFFGLTGGLIPCPAAITVLLICIQLKAFTLGAAMVVCFSIGLALTLVTVGVAASVSVQQATKRWSGFSSIARKAPYFSGALIALVGLYMGIHGFIGITN